jgi:hypothetical protein
MNRFRRLCSVLAWTLAVIIADTERRDPTRPRSAASGSRASETAPPIEPAAGRSTGPAASSASEALTSDPGQSAVGALATESPVPVPAPSPPGSLRDRAQPPATIAVGAPPSAPPDAQSLVPAPPPTETPPEPTAASPVAAASAAPPRLQGAVAGDGSHDCPDGFPIKGNASSMIYHRPGQSSYERTIPEFCFASAADAEAAGYRPPRR